ncbi:fimbrial outer membrane usher protein [Salmonella enterica subsp. enterica serovar Heidelberg str. 83-1068]|nr:fimbrial outer membrane usher protein [Salmonella enterica subsp. enterica serovar Heidelberg str. 83-1068]
MLRMTPIASLVLLTLFTWQTQAIATETFDTHFMVGGMRDQKIQISIWMRISQFRDSTNWIFMSTINGEVNTISLLPMIPVARVFQLSC